MRPALRLALLVGSAPAGAPALALAQTAHRPPAPPEGSIAEVVVRARPKLAPQVVATYPAQGSTVASGTLILKVVFNQAMTPQGWSYARAQGLDLPSCLASPRLLPDARTFVLLCSTAAGRNYGVGLNAEPPEGFADPFHRFAPRVDLRFATAAAGEPVRPVSEALAAAGLGPADGPINNWIGVAPAAGTAAAPAPRER